jgi:hypothetical protein
VEDDLVDVELLAGIAPSGRSGTPPSVTGMSSPMSGGGVGAIGASLTRARVRRSLCRTTVVLPSANGTSASSRASTVKSSEPLSTPAR